jgi:pre-mRNA-splicing factor SYF2
MYALYSKVPVYSHAIDLESTSHRKYKKDLDLLKPDLVTYNPEKERALGLEPGTLVKVEENGRMTLTARAKEHDMMVSGMSNHLVIAYSNIIILGATAGGTAAEGLYRDANSLSYADNKPSEEAIDRVVNKLNNEYVTVVCLLRLC